MKPQIIRLRPWIYKVTSTVSACAKSSEKPKFVIHLRRKRICVYQEERNTRFFISNTRDHPHSKYAQKSIKLEPSPPLYAIRRIWINPPPPHPPYAYVLSIYSPPPPPPNKFLFRVKFSSLAIYKLFSFLLWG